MLSGSSCAENKIKTPRELPGSLTVALGEVLIGIENGFYLTVVWLWRGWRLFISKSFQPFFHFRLLGAYIVAVH